MQRCPKGSFKWRNLNLNLIFLQIYNIHSVETTKITKKKKYSKLIIFLILLKSHKISFKKLEYKKTNNLDIKSSRRNCTLRESRLFNRVHMLLAQSSAIVHYDHKMYAWVLFFFPVHVHVFLCCYHYYFLIASFIEL